MLLLKPFGAENWRNSTHGRVEKQFLVLREDKCDAGEREERRGIYTTSG
jgi:hypothetical protein